jgi:hypothetical protein
VLLSRVGSDWRSALDIVKPATLIAWQRKGFRLFWTWKIRHGRAGRPAGAGEVRDLIRKMSGENPAPFSSVKNFIGWMTSAANLSGAASTYQAC